MVDRLRRRLANDIVPFIEKYGRTEVVHAPIVLHPIHRAMLDTIDYAWQRHLVPVVVMPYSHGKSSVALQVILWVLVHDQRLRLRYISASKDMAARATSYVRSIFETVPFQRDFGIEAARPWTPDHIVLKRNAESRDPTLVATGVLSVTSGVRGDLFVFDDLESDVDSGGEVDATKVRKAYKRLQTRLSDPWCRSLVVCTRSGVDDLVGDILANDQQRHAHAILVLSMETRGPQRAACIQRRVILPPPHDGLRHEFGWACDRPVPVPDLDEPEAEVAPKPAPPRPARRRRQAKRPAPPPPIAPVPSPEEILRREHESHMTFEYVRGVPLSDRFLNACVLCCADGKHRRFQDRPHLVANCPTCPKESAA